MPVFTVSFAPYGDVRVKPCSKDIFEGVILALRNVDIDAIVSYTSAIIEEMPCSKPLVSSCRAFLNRYLDALNDYCENEIDLLRLPERLEFGTDEKPKLLMPIHTFEEYLVHSHTGLNFNEIGKLDILTYRFYAAEALKINILKRADGTGTEYLNECYKYMHQIDDEF